MPPLSLIAKLSTTVAFFIVFSELSIARAAQIITNQVQLEEISLTSSSLSSNYILGNDIELSAPITDVNYYITGEFTGVFDGQNFTISGLTKPLFQEIASSNGSNDAVVKDLNLVGEVYDGAGFLAQLNNVLGEIQNVGARGTVTISTNNSSNNLLNVGGLVGRNNGEIVNSYTDVSVSANNYDPSVGGLVGENTGEISKSYSLGDVSAISSGNNGEVGGLTGINSGVISSSFSQGDVTVTNFQQGLTAGGLSGINNYGQISNSYSSGSVSGIGSVGGLVGSNMYGNIENSYSLGDVNGILFTGGLVGNSLEGTTITNSYSTSDVSCSGTLETCGALVGIRSTNNVSIVQSIGNGQITINSSPVTHPDQNSSVPELLSVIGEEDFTIDSCINSDKPILRVLRSTFTNSCTSNQLTFSRSSLNYVNFIIPIKSDASNSFGFNPNYLNLKSLGINVLIPGINYYNNSISILNFLSNKFSESTVALGDEFQLKIDHLASTPIQLWITTEFGNSTYIGDLDFGLDGKVVLPVLQFTKPGRYELLLSLPSIGDKNFDVGNQVGRLILNVIS